MRSLCFVVNYSSGMVGDLRCQQNLLMAGTDTGGHCNSLRRVGN